MQKKHLKMSLITFLGVFLSSSYLAALLIACLGMDDIRRVDN